MFILPQKVWSCSHEVTPKEVEEVKAPEEGKVTPEEVKVTPKDKVKLEKKPSFAPTMAPHLSFLLAVLLAIILSCIHFMQLTSFTTCVGTQGSPAPTLIETPPPRTWVAFRYEFPTWIVLFSSQLHTCPIPLMLLRQRVGKPDIARFSTQATPALH